MSEQGTGDPCATCGKPVDSHNAMEASKCREHRATTPTVVVPTPKPTVEAKVEEKPIAEQDNTKPELKPE